MNRAEAERNYKQIAGCLALLDRHHASSEQREVAKALGLEDWLPEQEQPRFDFAKKSPGAA